MGLVFLILVGSGVWFFRQTATTLFRNAAVNRRAEGEIRPTQPPLPQDPAIEVYFNHSQASVYTDSYRQIQRHGDDLERIIISAIDQANSSVDVAVQALELPLIAKAIVQSAQRGIRVRLIVENEYAGDYMPSGEAGGYSSTPNAALALLRDAAIPLIDDTADGSKGSGLMHHKFVVVDNRYVLTGSANFTYSGIHGDLADLDSRGNANVLLKIDDAAIASQFMAEFNQMWGDGPGNRPDSRFGLQKQIPAPQRTQLSTGASAGSVTLQFSPSSTADPWQNSTNGLIARSLSQSQKSIDLALFVFSDQGIANQLERQAAGGTQVRALIDRSFLYRSYSEALDMLGVAIYDNRCKIESGNQPWATPLSTVGSPQLSPGDKLHHKFALIDNTTVIVGSHNWSQSANAQNDETLLVIESATVAAHFSREFQRLYAIAKLGHTPSLQRKIQSAQQRCRS